MPKLLLIRHGQTVDNVAKLMQGQTQGELTQEGIEQARQLAERMKSVHIDAIYSSDLRRAIDTADIILAPHGLKLIKTPLLRERDWGGFTGRYIPDLAGEEWPDDIETMASMQQRARDFLNIVRHYPANSVIVAVGHGIINKVIQSVFRGVDVREVPRMDNAEVRELLL